MDSRIASSSRNIRRDNNGPDNHIYSKKRTPEGEWMNGKYEVLLVFVLGFFLGVMFLANFGGEYQRGKADGYAKSQDEWNSLISVYKPKAGK